MAAIDRRRLLALGPGALALAGRATRAAAGPEPPRLLPGERAALRAFPERLWTGSRAAEARLDRLLELLAAAEAEGLEPRAYGLEALAAARFEGPLEPLERAASAAFLAYAREVRRGRDLPGLPPRPVTPDEEPAALLAAAARTGDPGALLAGLPPLTARYARLKDLLAELRAVAARGGWTPVPPLPRLASGDTHPGVPTLRRRLRETGDLVGPEEGEQVDEALLAAIRAFQARHGLEPDGVLGRRTAAALAVPVETRIRQVILALERCRRFPLDPGPRHLFVNIADFSLEVVDRVAGARGERTVLTSPVVVGTVFHQTPTFTARSREIVLNPYWHVPRSIAVGELLPKIRKDPGWLARERMVVLDAAGRRVDPRAVDWASLGPGYFPYRLRQDWGEGNPLGRIKLEMPNPYGVYLHATARPELFDRPVRTFSHGCIRVAAMADLAALLLADQGFDRAALEAAIQAGGPRRIPILDPPLVHVTYLTAFVDAAGRAQFRDDVYGRDARLARSLGLN